MRPRIILATALSLACGLATNAQQSLGVEVEDPNAARFETAIRDFEAWDRRNSAPQDAVLFVGSSSIRMWPTAESFAPLPVINRGFGGSHTSDVNHFVERIVFKYAPRVIVFYAGDNDVAAGKSPRQVFNDTRTFIRLVHDRLPEARIVYLPIKPSLARWAKWPQMRETNELVEALAVEDERLDYVDTATPMLGDDGRPRSGLFVDDGLHLNRRGYELWNGILQPVLERQFHSNH